MCLCLSEQNRPNSITRSSIMVFKRCELLVDHCA
ncbi:hypothetical protein X801_02463 [Opisthorchis viverrini]|uniref:Uncharacterized protein n=1 Tax=Opisthorchis viverrini TaxID=6198 RepID=A0A1S8X4S0_OPIVI|nr:hypothetical protein X801_02463 [Opisthorchis viverrini]